MTHTVFTDFVTPVPASWLNDIDSHVYSSAPIQGSVSVHPASGISNTPAGTISATTVQAAINYLDGKVTPAAAGTLTGTTLAANVVTSSLTSVGTLGNLTVTNPISGSVTGSSGSTTGNAATVTTIPTLSGDVTNTGNAVTVTKINGTAMSGLATGILKNTTTTGVPSIAVAGDFPTLNQSTSGNAATATTATNLSGGTVSATTGSFTGLVTGLSGSSTGTAFYSTMPLAVSQFKELKFTAENAGNSSGGAFRGGLDGVGSVYSSVGIYAGPTYTEEVKFQNGLTVMTGNLTSTVGTTTLGATSTGTMLISTGAVANQLRVVQTTPPTCTTNCGTGGAVVGTDTAGIITMGATGTPASGFVITFNGTWASPPSVIVQSALSSMVTGKKPIAVQVTTTGFTVTTDGTAPGNSDKYSYHAIGVA